MSGARRKLEPIVTVDAQKLLRMAGQIAANITVSQDKDVIAAKVADHINRFWDPRMRNEFVEFARNNNELPDILKISVKKILVPGDVTGN